MKRKLLSILTALVCSGALYAQTTITTNHVNTNSNSTVTFHVQNTNSYPIVVTGVKSMLVDAPSDDCVLLTNSNAFIDNSPPWDFGTIGAGQNGWVLQGTSSLSNVGSVYGIVDVITDLDIVIAANTTVAFALSVSNRLCYMTLNAGEGVNTFSADGVNILTGDGISWGGVFAPVTPANYPRGFVGGITFETAVACTQPPAAPTISADNYTPCTSTSVNLSLARGAYDLNYQWQTSGTNGNYTDISGATSRKYTAAPPTASNTYYRCNITCGGVSDASTVFLATLPADFTQNVAICANGSLTVGTSVYTTAGNYTDVLTGPNGCDSTVYSNVTVLDVVPDSTQNVAICANGSLTVGTSIYTTAGNYTDVLTNANGCDSTVYSNVTVLAAQDVSTSVAGATIMATATGATYTWLDVDNSYSVIANASGQTYTPTASGNYAVEITEGTCLDTSATVNIVVTDLELFSSDGMALSISPNPTNASATLFLSGVEYQNAFAEGITMQLVNVMNQPVFSTVVRSEKTTIDLSNFQNGIYFVKLKSGNKVVTKKIVKN